jgi:hypothetical protein
MIVTEWEIVVKLSTNQNNANKEYTIVKFLFM